MLPSAVKNLIEKKIDMEIRYPADCEYLSFEIEKSTKRRISTNTIKRLFGFIQGVQSHRLYTLDIIARYIHFKNWDDLLNRLNESESPESYNHQPQEPLRQKHVLKVRIIESDSDLFQINDIIEIRYQKKRIALMR